MSDEERGPEIALKLRRWTDEIIRETRPLSPDGFEYLSPQILKYALHDLQVHQIELRVQNEELRRAQVELEAERTRYFDLYHQAPVGYCTLDAEGLILEANATADGLLCVPRGLLATQPITRFIHRGDQDCYYLLRKKILGTRERQASDLRMVAADGTVFWVHLDMIATQSSEGVPVFRLVIIDITERKRTEDQQRRLVEIQHQQGQKLESMGSLAGGVAHDMNNVLGAILGLASANLHLQPVGSPGYRAFDTIAKAAVRGAKLVGSLLTFVRQKPTEKRELDLNAILQEEVRFLECTTLAKVRLVMDLASDLRPIRGDASALLHAFMNLCVNAVDAMPVSGTLTLRTRNTDEGWAEVDVQDTGTGMPKEILAKALDPYFTTKEMGTGLGLSIVYSLVKAYHGEMELLSEPGQGTCVRMRFPSVASLPAVDAPAVVHVMASASGALQVLVVDDDELIQSSMQMILETLGHTATQVMSGEEALARLEAGFAPDVVILDMNMPGLGGAGTLPRLRALRPAVPVLLTTGRVDQTTLRLAKDHPGVTLLSKPFNLDELQTALESLRQG
jgi:two-component system, cell cycle sensor histidine kinase and response regulator CckA